MEKQAWGIDRKDSWSLDLAWVSIYKRVYYKVLSWRYIRDWIGVEISIVFGVCSLRCG